MLHVFGAHTPRRLASFTDQFAELALAYRRLGADSSPRPKRVSVESEPTSPRSQPRHPSRWRAHCRAESRGCRSLSPFTRFTVKRQLCQRTGVLTDEAPCVTGLRTLGGVRDSQRFPRVRAKGRVAPPAGSASREVARSALRRQEQYRGAAHVEKAGRCRSEWLERELRLGQPAQR